MSKALHCVSAVRLCLKPLAVPLPAGLEDKADLLIHAQLNGAHQPLQELEPCAALHDGRGLRSRLRPIGRSSCLLHDGRDVLLLCPKQRLLQGCCV